MALVRKEYPSRAEKHLGTYNVNNVGSLQGDTLREIDDTDTNMRLRRIKTIKGRRLHRARWYLEPAPTQIPQKIEHRNERSYNYDLRSWTKDSRRWAGTRFLKNAPYRKKH